MDNYLDSLEERMKGANSCKALADAAREAMESVQQAIDDATAQMESLAPLLVPPTTLPGVIIWIKNMIETIVGPYELLIKQLSTYATRLGKLQQLLSEKTSELACSEAKLPTPPSSEPM